MFLTISTNPALEVIHPLRNANFAAFQTLFLPLWRSVTQHSTPILPSRNKITLPLSPIPHMLYYPLSIIWTGEIHCQPAIRWNSGRLGTESPKERDLCVLFQPWDAPVLTKFPPQIYEWWWRQKNCWGGWSCQSADSERCPRIFADNAYRIAS